MTAKVLEQIIGMSAPALRSRVPVLFRVPALPLEAGDKLPVVACYDADGSLVIHVDTRGTYLHRGGERGGE